MNNGRGRIAVDVETEEIQTPTAGFSAWDQGQDQRQPEQGRQKNLEHRRLPSSSPTTKRSKKPIVSRNLEPAPNTSAMGNGVAHQYPLFWGPICSQSRCVAAARTRSIAS